MSSWTVCPPWTAWTKLHQASIKFLPTPQLPTLLGHWTLSYPWTWKPVVRPDKLPYHPISHPTSQLCLFFPIKESLTWDFPGSPVVKTPGFQCRGHKFNPCLGNENPTCCIVQPKRKKKPNPKMGDFSLQQVSPYNISTLAKRWPLLERERWEEKQVCSRWGSAGKNICILYNMWKLICIYHIYFIHTYA